MNRMLLPGGVKVAQAAAPTRKPSNSVAARFENAAIIGTSTVVLADVSGSMQGPVGSTTKFCLMQAALSSIWPTLKDAHLLAFSSDARVVNQPASLPQPDGGTALAEAFALAATFKPAKTVLICDGHPNDKEGAFAASRRLAGFLDVLYCGPSDDTEGIEFMRRLASMRNGRVVVVPMQVAHRNIFEEPLRRFLQG